MSSSEQQREGRDVLLLIVEVATGLRVALHPLHIALVVVAVAGAVNDWEVLVYEVVTDHRVAGRPGRFADTRAARVEGASVTTGTIRPITSVGKWGGWSGVEVASWSERFSHPIDSGRVLPTTARTVNDAVLMLVWYYTIAALFGSLRAAALQRIRRTRSLQGLCPPLRL